MVHIFWVFVPITHEITHLQGIIAQDIIGLENNRAELGITFLESITSALNQSPSISIPEKWQISEDRMVRRNLHCRISLKSGK